MNFAVIFTSHWFYYEMDEFRSNFYIQNVDMGKLYTYFYCNSKWERTIEKVKQASNRMDFEQMEKRSPVDVLKTV